MPDLIAHHSRVPYVEERRGFVSAFGPCEWEARRAAIDRVISRTAREQHA